MARALATPAPLAVNSLARRPSVFAAFGVTSFRYQFPADMLVAWAIEMEVIILAWYILIETQSAVALAVLGALRFGGTLISPVIGAVADRLSRKRILLAIRAGFVLLAGSIVVSSLGGWLGPVQVFIVATVAGLMRPADMMLRQSVIADAMPRPLFTTAMGFSRTTLDSARIVGALAGAGLMTALGLTHAYLVVAGFYLASTALSLRIRDVSSARPGRPATNPLQDLAEAGRYARNAPDIKYILWLAFLVNLTMLSITGGMLPLVAKDVYGLGANGLGVMVATFAGGALTGSLLIATVLRARRPERIMLVATIVWHGLMVGFAHIETPLLGIAFLGLIGFVSSFSMVPMASSLMLAIPADYRARIMGLRQLAVFGLPVGLLVSGWSVGALGVAWTFTAYGVFGLVASVEIWRRWSTFGGSAMGTKHN